ncbi:MAG TPA: biotin--[acetyl-CoA-carboxylase] ligase [Actinomycetales bacterium]|nr:biotin--[acetyl-CoA-carboxylase] ligase [Actinomycetales bacterium]
MNADPRKPLDADAIRAALPNWNRVDVVESTGSTNADLLPQVKEGAADRVAIVASEQTAGRGRLSRTWTAPPGAAIAVSALFRPEGVPPTALGLLPLVSGLAVVDMVRAVAGVDGLADDEGTPRLGLKWPNDVLLDGRKLCGILVEAASIDPPALVAGIGVNVDLREDELPVPHATSLALAGAPELDRGKLAAGLLDALDKRERQWRADPAAMMADYRANCLTLGTVVRVELPGGKELVGEAVGVREGGELVVRAAESGEEHVVTAGDVRHLRPVDGGYAGGKGKGPGDYAGGKGKGPGDYAGGKGKGPGDYRGGAGEGGDGR